MSSPRYYSRRNMWQKRLANAGEAQAAQYLSDHGYTIIARNWRAGKRGEIDIVALDPSSVLVFIEVKSRRIYVESEYGIDSRGFEAIDRRKQRKIITAARFYLRTIDSWFENRFDAITVVYKLSSIPLKTEPLPEPAIVHIVNAFRPQTNR